MNILDTHEYFKTTERTAPAATGLKTKVLQQDMICRYDSKVKVRYKIRVPSPFNRLDVKHSAS